VDHVGCPLIGVFMVVLTLRWPDAGPGSHGDEASLSTRVRFKDFAV